MSKEITPAAEYWVMASRLDAWPTPPDPRRLAQLRRLLMQSTRGQRASVPASDAEDVVQEAMVRFLAEVPSPASPVDEVRARLALRRERANFYRHRERHPEESTAEPEVLLAGGSGPDERFLQALIAIEQIAGSEVRRFAELRNRGYTLDDMAHASGWDAHRVDAARKQLGRYQDQIAIALAIHVREVPDADQR